MMNDDTLYTPCSNTAVNTSHSSLSFLDILSRRLPLFLLVDYSVLWQIVYCLVSSAYKFMHCIAEGNIFFN